MTRPPKPIVVERECGGWLAVSPEHHPFRIGVVADDESGVRREFASAVERWTVLANMAAQRAVAAS
jgi:hypothetical protein